ncbi:hypothetical protein [Denitromonas iodatirespirans]|uniref:Sulfotransferase n=1 Tax=Denitromonas iodatirespirans TaxID=2795389 RepID=A0A944D9Y5_DENI1|nr:hypothetical protein [Denitromonas iodatirespirans]MBT0960587.1 hypothetical protein [Denitromonas iodatirespirans]
MSLLHALIRNPSLVLRHRNIFLLSHMRANTSLFGHLIGSHPQVEGYYEMHIGYYSWKSLWRQKLRHFARHTAKPGARYMFDKVLHTGHHVAPALLQRGRTHTIFMLREPVQSIKSLVALFRKHAPHLPEATPDGAAAYYIERIGELGDIAAALGPRYFYLDAESLITDTDATLAALSDWLGFDTPIPSRYDTFANTGHGNTGDHSARLKSGQISRSRSDYSDIEIDPTQLATAEARYREVRAALIAGSARHGPAAVTGARQGGQIAEAAP